MGSREIATEGDRFCARSRPLGYWLPGSDSLDRWSPARSNTDALVPARVAAIQISVLSGITVPETSVLAQNAATQHRFPQDLNA